MPTRKEDNDEERQVRVEAMVEAHKRLIERSDHAKAMVRLAEYRARVIHALAVDSRRLDAQRRRTRKRA